MTEVIIFNQKTYEKIFNFYSNEFRKIENKNPYAILMAKDYNTTITFFKNRKVMFQGENAYQLASYWKNSDNLLELTPPTDYPEEGEIIKDEVNDFKNSDKLYFSSSLGSDEVGKGSYLGPLIVTATYVNKEDIPLLEKLGVIDSKLLKNQDIIKTAPYLINMLEHESIILSNEDYNSNSLFKDNNNNNININLVNSYLHNLVLTKLKEKLKEKNKNYDYIIMDQFVNSKNYYNYLKTIKDEKDKNLVITDNITFVTEGEKRNLAVSAASIISRYLFLKEMAKLSQKYGFIINMGSGNEATEDALKIVKKEGLNELQKIAKFNFNNTNNIIKKLKEN